MSLYITIAHPIIITPKDFNTNLIAVLRIQFRFKCPQLSPKISFRAILFFNSTQDPARPKKNNWLLLCLHFSGLPHSLFLFVLSFLVWTFWMNASQFDESLCFLLIWVRFNIVSKYHALIMSCPSHCISSRHVVSLIPLQVPVLISWLKWNITGTNPQEKGWYFWQWTATQALKKKKKNKDDSKIYL